MRMLMLLVLMLPLSAAFAEDAKMTADAQKVIDKYAKAVADAKKVYDAAVSKARDQALKDLKPIQTAETKKGNLDGAMMVKGKIEELTVESSTENIAAAKEPQLSKLTRDSIPSLLGTWVGEGGRKGGPDWTFAMSGKDLQLIEDVYARKSIKYTFTKDGKILFNWISNNVMEVAREGENDLKLTCIKGDTLTVWTQTLTKKQDK